jgi:subtilisin-like proprotein convertase family protein
MNLAGQRHLFVATLARAWDSPAIHRLATMINRRIVPFGVKPGAVQLGVIVSRWFLFCVVLFVCSVINDSVAFGQAGLRESLERLDTNQDGNIDPDEITPLSRLFLEQIAEARRISLDRPNKIEDLQLAARIYHALRNGVAGKDIQPVGQPSVRDFGPEPDRPLVPEFGLSDLKYPYLQEDLDDADRTLRRSDRNEDGYIDLAEAKRAQWRHRDPFEMDVDNDGRLSRMELTQRYARRRMLESASSELRQKAKRTGGEIRPVERREASRRYPSRDSGDYLSATVMSRFDQNRNGRLELQEAAGLGIPTVTLDTDRDGELSRDELNAYMKGIESQVGTLSEALPIWFFELDANGDEQISMAEFTSDWSAEKLAEFAAYDFNADGLITTAEVLDVKSVSGGTYESMEGQMLPPRKTVVSEIEVDDDYLVGDLNVQLSITHTYASYLDAYLIGPEGQRVELFSGIGGSDDHFDQTIFDDQSRYPITKVRAPFRGTFMPGALVKRQPSLSSFNGKSIAGVWKLEIRGSRSNRFGMLHDWSLIAKPQDMASIATAPSNDGPQAVAAARSEPPVSKPAVGSNGSSFAKENAPTKQELKQAFQFTPKKDWEQMDESERKEAIEEKRKAYEKYKAFLTSRKQQKKDEQSGDPGRSRIKLAK